MRLMLCSMSCARGVSLPPPPALPPWQTVYGYFRTFLDAGVWETIRHYLVTMLREGREASPTAVIIDTQSVKSTEKGGLAATMPPRRSRRHIGVDTSGFLLGVLAAGPSGNAKRYIQDADSAWDLLKKIKHLYCWLKVVFADSIFNRLPVLLACFLLGLTLIIVRRIAGTTGFIIIPRRWVVERTLGWLGRWRRLSKDYEELPEVSEARVTLAAIRMMLQHLGHPNRKRLPPP